MEQRLNLEWLTDEAGMNEDPWKLIQTDINDDRLHDALLGNGLIGLRFPTEGEGESYEAGQMMPPTGCFMHNLWTDHLLIPPPKWHGLSFFDGVNSFRRDQGEHANYQQCLDLRTATLETQSDWSNGERTTKLRQRAWLSLAQQDILVMQLAITPDYTGTVAVDEQLEGYPVSLQHCAYGKHVGARWQVTGENPDQQISLQARMGENFRQVAVASHVEVRVAGNDVAVETETVVEHSADDIHAAPYAKRRISFKVEAGTTYVVTKTASLINDETAGDALAPLQAARASIAAVLADPVPRARPTKMLGPNVGRAESKLIIRVCNAC